MKRFIRTAGPNIAGATATSKRHVEIGVSPEDDIEMRQINIANRGRVPRQIEFTSFAEVVLAPAASDSAHPAFSNLFVQTEILRERQAILCTRRPRSASEKPPDDAPPDDRS